KILNQDGVLILSGILIKYKDKIINKFSSLKVVDEIIDNEWLTIALKKVN
ncbi:MAG: 50S ribosomal protein L11 methyltransferase, partial [Campylobacterales bacterium]|nr:50S ribosomal protein L11 methyltransferase [Campylobacterales bacterium]